MTTVGITGGIGSGKTAICRLWEDRGARILFADDLAKKLMTEDPVLKKEIIRHFGEQAYSNNGSLNRAYLSRMAFEQNRVEDLNRLVHPFVYRKTDELINKAEAEGVGVFVKEAALLLQNGRPPGLDYVVLVTADEKLRKQRVAERDHVEEAEVERRMSRQQDFSRLEHLADFVIENNGGPGELRQKADALFDRLNAVSRKM